MRTGLLITAVLTVMLGISVARAEIYIWIDAKGIKHYTNTPPPEDAKVVEKREEKAHDAESHQRRMAAEQESYRAYQEAEAQRAREERELEMFRQQQAARQEAAEAARRAEAAAEKAAVAAEKAQNTDSGYIIVPPRYRPSWPVPYYPPHRPPQYPSRRPRPRPEPYPAGVPRKPLAPSGYHLP